MGFVQYEIVKKENILWAWFDDRLQLSRVSCRSQFLSRVLQV